MISFISTILGVCVLSTAVRRIIMNLFEAGVYQKTIIPKLLDYVFVINDGAAYGMLAGKKWLLVAITSVIIIAICAYVYVTRKTINKVELFSLSLIVGGGLCNLYERIVFDYVHDYIDIHILPVFNVADIAVTCGCVLLVIAVLIIDPRLTKNAERK